MVLVSVCTITYNQAPYIRQCLDAILMQKTTFPFEMLIHDDASTDGTADIIREYEARFPEIIKPIYQTENQYSKGITFISKFNYERARGKYIAMCEGDDYWTDPLKLQKQVDFLERNPDYSICGGKYWLLEAGETELSKRDWVEQVMAKYPKGKTVTLNNVYDDYLFWLLTVCFRSECLEDLYQFKNFKDDVLYAVTLSRGKGFVFPDYFGVYRLHQGGIWTGKSALEKLRSNEIILYELYPKFGHKSKSMRKWSYRRKIDIQFFELSESKHLVSDFWKMIRFTLSGGWDTFPYRIGHFLIMSWTYLVSYVGKLFRSKGGILF
jgi:glycosyltransferase involved in cell wall biosynthesis